MELDTLIEEYNESLQELSDLIIAYKLSKDKIDVITLQCMMDDIGSVLDGRKRTRDIKNKLRNIYDKYTLELEKYTSAINQNIAERYGE